VTTPSAQPRRLRRSDAGERQGRQQIGGRVHRHGDGRGQPLKQQARQRRTGHLGHGLGGADPGVGVDDQGLADQARQVGMIGDVEEHACGAHQGRGGIDLHHAEQPQPGGDRQGDEDRRASEVGSDQDRAPRRVVDEVAGGETDQQGGAARQGIEQAELAGCGGQAQNRHHRQAVAGDPRAEVGDSLGCPQAQEVAVAPQGAPGLESRRGLGGHGKGLTAGSAVTRPRFRRRTRRTGRW
jgi:hypothetical protein